VRGEEQPFKSKIESVDQQPLVTALATKQLWLHLSARLVSSATSAGGGDMPVQVLFQPGFPSGK